MIVQSSIPEIKTCSWYIETSPASIFTAIHCITLWLIPSYFTGDIPRNQILSFFPLSLCIMDTAKKPWDRKNFNWVYSVQNLCGRISSWVELPCRWKISTWAKRQLSGTSWLRPHTYKPWISERWKQGVINICTCVYTQTHTWELCIFLYVGRNYKLKYTCSVSTHLLDQLSHN